MTGLRLADDPPRPADEPRPLLIDETAPGCDAYVCDGQLPRTDLRRRWTLWGQARSVEQRSGGIVKLRSLFDHHIPEQQFRDFLSDCAAHGVERPSSYGDCFHQRNATPRHPTYSKRMFPHIPGGWQAVLGPIRKETEPLYQYDLRSAYLWSLAQGLPDPTTFRRVKRFNGPGLYWIESPAHPALPYPWRWPGWYPATFEEIETLHLDRGTITAGVSFIPSTFDIAPYRRDILAWGAGNYKAVARAYWGRWASLVNPVCQTFRPDGELNTERELRDPTRAPVWAAIITARVRLRLWQTCWTVPVLRVYVDSVITKAPLETGAKVGDWALKDYYPRGGVVTLQKGVLAA